MKIFSFYILAAFIICYGCSSKIDFEVMPPPPPVITTELMISEISTAINTDPNAGGTRTHYVELFNGTANAINLSNYAIGYMAVSDTANLIPWSFGVNFFVFPAVTLDTGKCYVVASPQSDRTAVRRDTSWGTTSTLAAQASTPLQLSGNSAIALLKRDAGGTIILNGNTYAIIDAFGSPLVTRNTSTGATSSRNNIIWTIAGVTDTRNRTFFRKKGVLSPTTDWGTTKGSSPETSQWIVSGDRAWDYTNLGKPTP
ncbi:MAG: lamin tail domain-containing protein [Chitinophagaceae bacterium]|nr:lamin tail domain-containing protein [Chitinophagaceae bacterium]